jgi:fucose permease
LRKLSEKIFFRINMTVVLLALAALVFVINQSLILALVCIIAFGSSSIFAVIYTLAIKSKPSLTNEISGLMVTGIAGGAIFPPLMGFATEYTGSQQGGVGITILCATFLVYCSFKLNNSALRD